VAILGIDHLVIAVRDPDAAAADLERELGLAFTGGGRHETAGTWNRLAFLGDSYLELIGVFDRDLVLANPGFAVSGAALAVLDAGREGLATWSVSVDDCAVEVTRLRHQGSRIGDPVPGSRVRPDGETVRWVTAFPPLGPEEPPFLIEHEMVGAEWGPDALAARRAFRHPGLGRARLDRLVLPVADPVAYGERCEDTVGIRFRADLSGWTAFFGFDTVHLHPTATGLPMVQLATPAPDVERRSVVRCGIDWYVDPG
jgi:Glyoxalase-like domain